MSFDFSKKPFLIAGPCSVESEEQVMAVANGIAEKNQIAYLRGGIWKPRTRPGSFEGLGAPALPWLINAAKENGLQSITEIASPKHLEEGLKAGIDAVWIGARTTVNPFAVQQLADALRGIEVPVFIKNPVNPDVALWQGAVERIANAGIEQIALIHRGFSNVVNTFYRNDPMWALAIRMREKFPDLPMVCDPSHIGGKCSLIAPISQKAMDLDMHGLMIEVHPNPDVALSDAAQQLTPTAFNQMMSELVIRSTDLAENISEDKLADLRKVIDQLDEDLVNKIRQRMDIVEQIGEYKRENNITVLQIERWREILNRRGEQAQTLSLDESFVREVFEAIHHASISKQTEIYGELSD